MKKLLTNNLLYKLISLIFAIVMWLLVVNISDPTVTRTISGIPVVKTEENVLTEQGKVYVVLEGNSASISVKGPRSVVDELGADDFLAEAPFSELTNMNTIPIYVSHKYAKYEKSVEITQKTRTMILSIESIGSKYFDIEVNDIGQQEEGYYFGGVRMSENSVKVTAPESVLAQIAHAVIDVDITNLKGNMETELVIKYYDADGHKVDLGEYASVSTESVTVTVTIYPTAEVPVTVAVTGEVAEGYQYVDTQLSHEKVMVTGENVANVDSIVLPNDLFDITGATEDMQFHVDISKYLPEGVKLLYEEQKMLSLIIKVEKYVIDSYNIPSGNMELRNLPDGMEATIEDETVSVSLIGLQDAHDALSVDNLYGYIDMSGARTGSHLYDVVLQLPEEMTLNSEVKVRIRIEREKETPKETTTEKKTEDTEEESKQEETTTDAKPEETVAGDARTGEDTQE